MPLRYSAKKTGLERVVFVLYDEPAYQTFKRGLSKQLGQRANRKGGIYQSRFKQKQTAVINR